MQRSTDSHLAPAWQRDYPATKARRMSMTPESEGDTSMPQSERLTATEVRMRMEKAQNHRSMLLRLARKEEERRGSRPALVVVGQQEYHQLKFEVSTRTGDVDSTVPIHSGCSGPAWIINFLNMNRVECFYYHGMVIICGQSQEFLQEPIFL